MDITKWVSKNLVLPVVLLLVGLIAGLTLSDNFMSQAGLCTAGNVLCIVHYGTIFSFTFVGMILLIALLLDAGKRVLGLNQIRIVGVENLHKIILQEPIFGHSKGIGLRVINKGPEITECFGTLELAQLQIVRKGKLQDVTHPFQNFGMAPLGTLRWDGVNSDELSCKISMATESKENIILIANLINAVSIEYGQDKTPIVNPVEKFDFALCKSAIQVNPYGLYKIRVRINGKIKTGRDMVCSWHGYIYCSKSHLYLINGKSLNDPRISNLINQEVLV